MQKTLSLTLAGAALSLFLSGCGGSGSGVEGTWALDTSAMKEAALAKMPEEQRNDPMVQGMLKMFDNMKMTVVFKADGTCTGDADMPGGKKEKTSGTWKMEGEYVLATMKDEKGKEDPQKLLLKGDVLELKPQGAGMGGPSVMIFRRQ